MKILTSSDGIILIIPPDHNLGVSANINSHLDIATQPLGSKEISLKMLSGPPRMAKHDSRGFFCFCFCCNCEASIFTTSGLSQLHVSLCWVTVPKGTQPKPLFPRHLSVIPNPPNYGIHFEINHSKALEGPLGFKQAEFLQGFILASCQLTWTHTSNWSVSACVHAHH